ncbi:uncharacterized protein LOC121511845 [Cheilinus undulatus]|uniref:uncharacterized protein LOC121511845 n=1 Tax=Cheilinus undulatus TaxID=241271 RepID=UPI001BD2D64F|nr:uncharacterized protein LOC121511845 [Cheilinus undulatus]
MATLSSDFVEDISKDECKEDELEEEEEIEVSDEEKEEAEDKSVIQQQKKPAWAPCFFFRTDREVYSYVGQEIIIEEGLDSYAGMIWPAALALCHYLDTHRQQISMVGKAVLEIGAGTGLVSIVATLLGAWVTATDLPEVLNNLRVNLNRNTRGRCRYTPQVAVLPWGYNLEDTYPTSVYRYDYVLAADVVYHHDFLDELLATMKHFCRPGTTLIWANKVRFETDLTFTENFKKAFNTTLLLEDGEMKIFMATCREEGEKGVDMTEIQDLVRETEEEDGRENEEDEEEAEPQGVNTEEWKEKENDVHEIPMPEKEHNEEEKILYDLEEKEQKEAEKEDEEETDEEDKTKDDGSSCSSANNEHLSEETHMKQTAVQQDTKPAWVPSIISKFGRDIYHYVGEDIVIQESIDSYGAVMWPAALALCSFLENNRERVNLKGKEVLELGAGTGLVTIVASLLGASVTATDLPDVLGNLRSNVMRNTRGRCRYTPQVEVLSWGYNLKHTHPTSVYHYDYILAADVVYHHDFLGELLATMKHFCRPGTTLIWANKVRFEADLTFTENFKKAFNTTLLLEDGEMKIFMATYRE